MKGPKFGRKLIIDFAFEMNVHGFDVIEDSSVREVKKRFCERKQEDEKKERREEQKADSKA